ncbi:hypothetical protein GWI33_000218 [Rhynchophorus ferrugineus]|uniref:Uncharacterized protein n=1 Tax=Rhynchophorus ferrugineus TaxID=354439 RepID=A0A834IWV6_RHYFE|nr:hypothetical protein GWI33_000218 [Rhynchophorus ferrugineus]
MLKPSPESKLPQRLSDPCDSSLLFLIAIKRSNKRIVCCSVRANSHNDIRLSAQSKTPEQNELLKKGTGA